MKPRIAPLPIMILMLLTACRSDPCPAGSVTYVPDTGSFPPTADGASLPIGTPVEVEIGRRTIQVDRIVRGPLCNENWSGTVYVACDVQIAAWDPEGAPTFLKGCDFTVEPETVVYVAAHNNSAYYQGCSCHTGE